MLLLPNSTTFLFSLLILLAFLSGATSAPLPASSDSSSPSPLSDQARMKRAFDRFDHGGIFVFGGTPHIEEWDRDEYSFWRG